MGAALTAVGAALPSTRLENAELAERFGVTEDWIVARTGIQSRRIASDEDSVVSLATTAGREVLTAADVDPQQVDVVIVATCSSGRQLPANAPLVATEIGARNAAAFDLNGACSGFLFSLAQATALVENGTARRVLVCGSDLLTRYTDPDDRGSSILFGDGAGAALVEYFDGPSRLGPFNLRTDGSRASILAIPDGEPYLHMEGREVYRHAVEQMSASVAELLKDTSMSGDDVDLLVAHQANARILRAVADRLGFPMEKVLTNIAQVGNTSAASIPLALADAYESGTISDGDNIVLTAFGAGFTWGAGLVVWGTGDRQSKSVALAGDIRG
ncbi:MAG TPA: beta-ketoacyl-ACP synthase III [Actinomycetota bacterium]|jgi:3-oxoacyl-[acyl-carrier-protein] synthase-3|nr:beta-ketoacyl-ACP synthase III [Actinomycetota bacterium]